MTIDEVAKRFDDAKKVGNGYKAKCPCHDDANASLSISEGDGGRILVKCFAGCDTAAVLEAKGLKMQDLFNDPGRRGGTMPRREVAHYDYFTRDGAPLVRVVRYEPKDFRRMSPDGRGGWKKGGTGNTPALYHWPELAEACRNHAPRVWIVEGEKDRDNFYMLKPSKLKEDGEKEPGVVVTTPIGGASKWRNEYAAEFSGAGEVFVVADNDDAGRSHARRAVESLKNAGLSARAFVLPDELAGRKIKDVSDAIAAGWKLADFDNWAEVAPDLEAEAQGEDTDEEAGTLEAAILVALGRERERTEGRVKAERVAEIASKVGIEWLLKHGRFFNDVELKGRISGTYYLDAGEKRLLYMGGECGSRDLPYAPWLASRSGLPIISSKYKRLFTDTQVVAAASDKTTPFTPCRYWERREIDGREVVYMSCGEGRMCRIAPGEDLEIVDNGTDGVLFVNDHTLSHWELVPYEKMICPLECDLFRGMTVANEDLRWLFLFWMMTLPLNLKNRPPLLLGGTVGCGKTRTAAGVFELYGLGDPRIVKTDEEKDDSFWVSLHHGGLIVADNVDHVCKWLADTVAAASTGGSKEVRALYTNGEKFQEKARASIIITSSNPSFAGDPGLAGRLITVNLESKTDRVSRDIELTKDIERKRNGCMTWIAYVIRDALELAENPPTAFNKRHPDWARWVWKFGVALEERDKVERILTNAEENKSRLFFETDAFAGAVLHLVRKHGGLDVTSAELLEMLKADEGIPQKTRDAFTAKSIGRKIGSGWSHFQAYLHAKKVTAKGFTHYRFTPPAEVGGEGDNAVAEVGGCDTYNNDGDEATLDL